ncbi:hypothetical protein Ancab_004153 [Ancistrocladus abbreviatus]
MLQWVLVLVAVQSGSGVGLVGLYKLGGADFADGPRVFVLPCDGWPAVGAWNAEPCVVSGRYGLFGGCLAVGGSSRKGCSSVCSLSLRMELCHVRYCSRMQLGWGLAWRFRQKHGVVAIIAIVVWVVYPYDTVEGFKELLD